MRIILGMTGASGAILGIKLLQELKSENTYLIISENGKKIIEFETNYKPEDVENMATRIYSNDDLSADISSGTSRFDAMVIAPCSTSTLSKIACGISDNLITRVAAVALKEQRKLIIVLRENPLSPIVLENMTKLAKLGVNILMPVPAFYLKQKKIEDVVDYTAGKVLDILNISHSLYPPYSPQ